MLKLRHIVLVVSIACGACANFSTLERRSELPGVGNNGGRAIHLDAEQRLVLAKNFGTVCAEPSPDALTAFASSVGGGLSVPSQGAISFAQALNETTASIGLRTQSITLMRDELYRICEAYYSRALTGPAVAALLSRSQDITVAILAIEQLTGAVAAHQVSLGGEAGAASSSNLAFIQDLLDGSRANETAKQEDATKAKTDLEAKESDLAEAKTERDGVKGQIDAATAPGSRVSANDVATLQSQLKNHEQRVAAADAAVKQSAAVRDKADALAAEATKTREAIEKNHTTALTSATATAAGRGIFSGPASSVKLDAQSTQHIAATIEKVAKAIVEKDYAPTACLAFIADNPPARVAGVTYPSDGWTLAEHAWVRTHEHCLALLGKKFGVNNVANPTYAPPSAAATALPIPVAPAPAM